MCERMEVPGECLSCEKWRRKELRTAAACLRRRAGSSFPGTPKAWLPSLLLPAPCQSALTSQRNLPLKTLSVFQPNSPTGSEQPLNPAGQSGAVGWPRWCHPAHGHSPRLVTPLSCSLERRHSVVPCYRVLPHPLVSGWDTHGVCVPQPWQSSGSCMVCGWWHLREVSLSSQTSCFNSWRCPGFLSPPPDFIHGVAGRHRIPAGFIPVHQPAHLVSSPCPGVLWQPPRASPGQ